MEPNIEPSARPAPISRFKRTWLPAGALALGLAIGGAGLAGAATGGSSDASGTSDGSSTTAPVAADSDASAPTAGQRPDPSAMTHGPGETLLTGDDATKVTHAALAAVPGAEVIRVETDSGDATYEAHLRKSDGSFATVLFDADFTVTSTNEGFGLGPGGHAPPAAATGTSN